MFSYFNLSKISSTQSFDSISGKRLSALKMWQHRKYESFLFLIMLHFFFNNLWLCYSKFIASLFSDCSPKGQSQRGALSSCWSARKGLYSTSSYAVNLNIFLSSLLLQVYFKSEEVRACIVTCGGLCPGINTVIREIVCGLNFMYGVDDILGIEVSSVDESSLYKRNVASFVFYSLF